MFVDTPVKAWHDNAAGPLISLTQTARMTPNEALEVAEKLRLIALIARGLQFAP